jgi:hypothetical protein
VHSARGKRATPVILIGVLVAGWLLGLASQVVTRQATGYMDIFPPQMLLGILLCVGAGAAARVVDPVRRTWRRGSLAGIAMIASIFVGYLILTTVLWNSSWSENDGETWWSLLIEAPFWIGVPTLIGAGFGALGWRLADRRARPSEPTSRSS